METETEPTIGRHETPEARLVLSAHAPREEWLAYRRSGITATDLVAIMGQSAYRTAFDIWTDKVMPPPEDETDIGEAGFWGQRLEEPVAQAWAEKHNVRIRRIGLVANDKNTWALASLDRIVNGCPDGRCALEVKTRNLFVQSEWEKALPVDVETQVRWQLLVTGLDHAHVAALIGGQRMVEHRVDRDAEKEQRLIDAAKIIWDAVVDRLPPNLPADLWTSDFLEQRHPDRTGEIEVGDEAFELAADYNRISNDIKYLEAEKAKIRTAMIGTLGEHEVAIHNGKRIFSYKASTRRTLDSKALVAKIPEIETDESVWKTTTSRTLWTASNKEGTTNE